MTMKKERAGKLLHDELMSKHTTWRVGGPADVYHAPRCRAELLEFFRGLDASTPVYWVGFGSNLLVRDGGIRGVVIATSQALSELRNLGAGIIEAEAGVACTVVARQCSRWQLGPAEFFAGIPGSIGGALRMNAGAFGGETWNSVIEVDVLDRHGVVHTRPRDAYEVGYRQVQKQADEWFLAARMQFTENYQVAEARMRTLIAERKASQPLGLPSCGSVFKNPPGEHAARLIETAGLKEARVGGAQVSPKHANFIINTGGATAADIEALIRKVQSTVESRHGVRLETEVQIIGEPLAGHAGAEGA
ncbi:MAG: UDP-N-acetylmuramate dehydrogenase [Gammaproteobacteria bacterium]|jgi:UDP-N-acetylmuramate dehydrogenase